MYKEQCASSLGAHTFLRLCKVVLKEDDCYLHALIGRCRMTELIYDRQVANERIDRLPFIDENLPEINIANDSFGIILSD